MKRVHFVSGFNAKLAAAACVVAGFSLAGCDEESFTVDVPNVEVQVPNITWPEQKDGIAYVLLSATSSTGEQIDKVTFKIDGTAQEEGVICVPVDAGKDHEITAEKEGYLTGKAKITVPELPKDVVINIPVHVILTPVNLEDYDIVADVDMNSTEKKEDVKKSVEVPEPENGFQAGNYTVTLPLPTAEPYLTEEQREAFRIAVNELLDREFPATRADADEKTHVRDLFYARIKAYNSSAKLEEKEFTFNLDIPAESVKLDINTVYYEADLALVVHHNDKEYKVTEKCTFAGFTEITAIATPIDNGHNGHNPHGDDPNSGGASAD